MAPLTGLLSKELAANIRLGWQSRTLRNTPAYCNRVYLVFFLLSVLAPQTELLSKYLAHKYQTMVGVTLTNTIAYWCKSFRAQAKGGMTK